MLHIYREFSLPYFNLMLRGLLHVPIERLDPACCGFLLEECEEKLVFMT